MNDVELAVELSDNKHRIKSLEHRMDDSEKEIGIIHTIAKTLELLVYKADNTEKNVEKLTVIVEGIKSGTGRQAKTNQNGNYRSYGEWNYFCYCQCTCCFIKYKIRKRVIL